MEKSIPFIRGWTLVTTYDYLWATKGMSMLANEWRWFRHEGYDESVEWHRALILALRQKRDFWPVKTCSVEGYAIKFGNGEDVINEETGRIGGRVITSDVVRFFYERDELFIKTLNSIYHLENGPILHEYERNPMSSATFDETAKKYFNFEPPS